MQERPSRSLAFTLPLALAIAVLSCQRQTLETSTPASVRALGGTLVGDPGALAQDDGQWVMPAKNYASTRFSGLNEITAQNVSRLGVAWTFSTGMVAGHEAAPLVVGGTMYLVTPFPNIVYAFDLTRPGAPIKWQYDPKPLGASKGVACCDLVNRGAAYAGGMIFFNTLDGQTIALDAGNGQPKWITQLGDINKGETITMAPLVVKGKVLVGNSGGEFGVRGWLTALDAATGTVVWRAYSTGPDKDVLIGPSFKPFYAGDRGKDLGITTWPGEGWHIGGGTVWGWISYDPELDLILYGTGNPGPWNPEQRPGDNKWTTAIFAREARHWRGAVGVSDEPARPLRPRRRQRARACRSASSAIAYGRLRCARIATAYSTSWTAPTVRCSRRLRSGTSTRTGRRPEDRPPDPGRGEDPARRALSSATSARRLLE